MLEENRGHFVMSSLDRLSFQRIPDLKVSTIHRVKTFTKSMFGIEDSMTRIVNKKQRWRTPSLHERLRNEGIEIDEETGVDLTRSPKEGPLISLPKESEKRKEKFRLISRMPRVRILPGIRRKSNKIVASHQPASQEEGETSDRPSNRLSTSLSTRLSNKFSDLYKKNTLQGEKVDKWINNGKILTEDSPEVINFRNHLFEINKPLPDNTSLCMHLQKNSKGDIVVETHGTLSQYSRYGYIRKLIEQHFTIEGKHVRFPNRETAENDHYIASPIAEPFAIRDSEKLRDLSLTIRLPRELHAKRTNDPEIISLTYSLDNLTQPLHSILKPLRTADTNLWMKSEHESDILKTGLTPKYLVDQAERAHTVEMARMYADIDEAGFHAKQATAFVTDRMLQLAIESSVNRFIKYRPITPILNRPIKASDFQLEQAVQKSDKL